MSDYLNEEDIDIVDTMLDREYFCSKCGAKMEFEDSILCILICTKCGHEVSYQLYGSDKDEEYDTLYKEEDLDADCSNDKYDEEDEENDEEEMYEEVCGELSND